MIHYLFQVHKSEKQYKCNECGIRFRHNNSLVRHLFQHSGERPYGCQQCNASFTQLNRLKEHIKKHHENISTSILRNKIDTCVSGKVSNISNHQIKPKTLHTTTSHYKPIAPAPTTKLMKTTSRGLSNPPVHSSSGTVIIPSNLSNTAIQQSSNSYLTQAANGTMFLVTNPIPTISTQPSPILVSNANGVLQLLQQPASFNPGFVIPNAGQSIPGYVQTPVLSSFPAFQQQPIQFLPMSSFSNPTSQVVFSNCSQTLLPQRSVSNLNADIKQEKTLDHAGTNDASSMNSKEVSSYSFNNRSLSNSTIEIPESLSSSSNSYLSKESNRSQVEISSEIQGNTEKNNRNYSSVSPKQFYSSNKGHSKDTNLKIQYRNEESDNPLKDKTIFSVGTLNENTVSYQNETGETVKLDILERAILTIPDL